MFRIKQRGFRFSPFSPKQLQVLTWWNPNSPVHDRDGIIADGAVRSGKTLSMSLAYVMWAMATFDSQFFIMAGKTVQSFRRNVLLKLKPMLTARGYEVEERRTENMVVVRKGERENAFFIFGGRDESSQDLVQGITAAGAFFDEVALMPQSFVNQATARCSVDGSKFWFNCNPAGPFHWFKLEWIDKADLPAGTEGRKNLVYLHFTMEDNLSLSPQIRERYRNQYSGVFYDRYIRGLWVQAEGLVYDQFDRTKHVVKLADIPSLKADTYYVSCDYGTENATVFHLWAQGTDGVWYCLKEYYYSGRDEQIQKTDSQYADDLRGWLGGQKIQRIVVDSSASSFIAELKKRGYRVKKSFKGPGSVLDGIRYTASLLNNRRILFAEICTKTFEEFAVYAWNTKIAETRGEDVVIKQHDHAMDSIRYFCYTVIRKPGGLEILK